MWCGESQPLWGLFPFPRGKSQDRASMGNSLDIFREGCVLVGCCAWCFLLLYLFFLYCDTLPLLPFVLFYLIASSFLLVLSFFSLSLPLLRFC